MENRSIWINITIILLTMSFVVTHELHWPLPKCCPRRYILVEGSNGTNCERPFRSRKWSEMVPIEMARDVNQINPSICQHRRTIHHKGCADLYLNNQTQTYKEVVMSCQTSENVTIPKLLTILSRHPNIKEPPFEINLCCPVDEIFGYDKHQCVKGQKMLYSFIKLLETHSNFGVFHKPQMDCRTSVLVDYKLNMQNVSIENNTLKISFLQGYEIDLLKKDSNYCIDSSGTTNDFVIRLCDKTIHCENHFCLEKCSSANANVEMDGNNKLVEITMKKSLYAGILETNSTQFLSLKKLLHNSTEVGIIKNSKCTNGYKTLTANWTINLLGKLYLLKENVTLSRDNYCIDILSTTNETDVAIFTCQERESWEPIFDYRFVLCVCAGGVILIFLFIFIMEFISYCRRGPSPEGLFRCFN